MTPIAFPCLSVFVRRARAEETTERLIALGATAIEERDETTMTGAGADDAACLIAGFTEPPVRDRAALSLAQEGVEAVPMDVTDDGWSSGWRAFFKPVELSSLLIVTPWMRVQTLDRAVIVIDPGLAFGTGGHATTRLVLSLLERRAIESGLPAHILDVGAGSGVLAIAAIKLGAERALAIDIDPAAVLATAKNAAANGVAEAVEARRGTAADVSGAWPLVLANIELAAFLECAAEIAALVPPGGEVYLSGLLESQVDACAALFSGFERIASTAEDGWAALALRRAP
jgi:ribosomal protein L11 methyltransferase